MLDKNLPFIIQFLSEFLQTKKGDILDEFLKYANFLIKEEDIRAIVDIIIDREMPKFISKKGVEIQQIVKGLLEYKLKEVGVNLSDIDKNQVKQIIITLSSNSYFQTSINSVSKSLLENFMKLKIADILKIFNLNSFKDIREIFEPILTEGTNSIKNSLEVNKKTVKETTLFYMDKIIEEILKQHTLNDILKNTDFKGEFAYISSILLKDKQFNKTLDSILDNLIQTILSDKFYNKNILKEDIKTFIQKSIQNDKDNLKLITEGGLKELFLNLNSIVTFETKKEVLSKIIEAFVLSLENNLNLVISAIDLEKIIETEINNMSPQEIEELFNSFAEGYFNKLKLYGIGGGVFGLFSLIPLAF